MRRVDQLEQLKETTGDKFLDSIITGDDTWYTTRLTTRVTAANLRSSYAKKKFKAQPSIEIIMGAILPYFGTREGLSLWISWNGDT
jgi:hypothetical protein